ncbi:hypothetical protein Godav_014578 [Gossypium davidsonii]|uniref:Uncharacterized protein n=1 Tax=Gossypium davidsonii TaxID=34287 RepID=A0A7J8RKJ0_GOSDV|nr:hypothetical protein [Gossypium davidsonii]
MLLHCCQLSTRPHCSTCRGNQQEQIHDSYILLEPSSI